MGRKDSGLLVRPFLLKHMDFGNMLGAGDGVYNLGYFDVLSHDCLTSSKAVASNSSMYHG